MGTVLTQPQPQHEGTIFASPGLQYWTWSQLPRCLWCSWSRCVTWCVSQFSSNIGQRSSSDQCSSVSGVTFTCLRCVRCEWGQAPGHRPSVRCCQTSGTSVQTNC